MRPPCIAYGELVDPHLENSPPRRPRQLLQQWVDDFRDKGHVIAGTLRVVEQEDAEAQDTGLVVINLHGKNVSVYMQPKGYDELLWEATMTARPDEQSLTPHELASLAAELVVAGNLCSYLQWRSLEWDRESGRHER